MYVFVILCIVIGLLLGFYIAYMILPSRRVIIKYPNTENVHNTTYIDENGLCYKYYPYEIGCTNLSN